MCINFILAQDLDLKYLLGNNAGVPEDVLTSTEFAQLMFPTGWSNVKNMITSLDDISSKTFSLKADSDDKMFLSTKVPLDFESVSQYHVRIKVGFVKDNVIPLLIVM